MAAHLVTNTQAAFGIMLYCWLNSTVALYWISNQGKYCQFVANCINKILQHHQINWHHMLKTDNPGDIGSRGGNIGNEELWKNSPLWLSDPSKWPTAKLLETTPETKAEAKATKEYLWEHRYIGSSPIVRNSVMKEKLVQSRQTKSNNNSCGE